MVITCSNVIMVFTAKKLTSDAEPPPPPPLHGSYPLTLLKITQTPHLLPFNLGYSPFPPSPS